MINTPEDIKAVEDLQTQLDSIRNNITLNEAEVIRLKKLSQSLNYTVGQLHNDKSYTESEIVKLQEQKKIVEDKRDTEIKDLEDAKKELEEITTKISETNKELEQLQSETNQKKIDLDKRENDLNTKEDKLNELEYLLQKKIDMVSEQHAKTLEDVKKIEALRDHITNHLSQL